MLRYPRGARYEAGHRRFGRPSRQRLTRRACPQFAWCEGGSDMTAMTATAVPVPDVRGAYQAWVVAAFLLGTIVRDALGDPAPAGRALQRALDLAEPGQVLVPFVIDRRRATAKPLLMARPGYCIT